MITDLDCVQSVFVPEGDLFKGAERQGLAKVQFRPISTDDSYQVVFKGCMLPNYKEPLPLTEEAPGNSTRR